VTSSLALAHNTHHTLCLVVASAAQDCHATCRAHAAPAAHRMRVSIVDAGTSSALPADPVVRDDIACQFLHDWQSPTTSESQRCAHSCRAYRQVYNVYVDGVFRCSRNFSQFAQLHDEVCFLRRGGDRPCSHSQRILSCAPSTMCLHSSAFHSAGRSQFQIIGWKIGVALWTSGCAPVRKLSLPAMTPVDVAHHMCCGSVSLHPAFANSAALRQFLSSNAQVRERLCVVSWVDA
jgi:hypothetical protein